MHPQFASIATRPPLLFLLSVPSCFSCFPTPYDGPPSERTQLPPDFVFLSIDQGSEKRPVVERLEEWGVPFIDVGMGVTVVGDSLLGILRVVTSTTNKRDHFGKRVSFADGGDNDYSRNIQIADLNALNAALAVVKWKKLCGFYQDREHEHFCAYTTDGNALLNEDQL